MFSCGCNAVYFYETEKASLTLEVRPDPTAPVSGNFGLKQRVAAIVPPTLDNPKSPKIAAAELPALIADAEAKRVDADAAAKQATSAPADQRPMKTAAATAKQRAALDALEKVNRGSQDAAGDCLSVLSNFKFHKFPRTGNALFGRIAIEATLITGDAAKTVADNNQTSEAISALSGQQVSSTQQLYRDAAVRGVVSGLRSMQPTDSAAGQLLAGLDTLAADLPQTLGFTLYQEQDGKFAVAQKPTDSIPGTGVDKFLNYHDLLHAADRNLAIMLADLAAGKTLVLDGGGGPDTIIDLKSPQGALLQQGLQSQLNAIRSLEGPVEQKLVRSAAYKAAARYYMGL